MCKLRNYVNSRFYPGLSVSGMLLLLVACGGGGGKASDSSSANARSTKQAILSWKAPETRMNGDVLSAQNLASYEIRYGKNASILDNLAIVDRVAGLIDVSYTIDSLSEGTWYFTIQARDDSGLLSLPSDIVSKRIAGFERNARVSD